jgi:hypothetical protein
MATLQSIERDDLVERLRNLLSAAEGNGHCAANLRRALERFTALECRRQTRRALADASGNRDQIIARLALLAEIELLDLPEVEAVLTETAALFDEIGASAARAAEALRHAGSLRQGRDRDRGFEKPPLAA